VKDFLQQWIPAFSKNPMSPNPYKGPAFRINTGSSPPIKDAPRRQSPWKELEIAKHIDLMLKNNIVERADSPRAAPVVLAKKKDGTVRFCNDYRKLNEITTRDVYPLPRVDDSLAALSDMAWFSTMDMTAGFHQIKLNDKDGISGEAKSFGMNSRHVEPLCYPVLFPHGESGWGEGIKDLVSFYQYLASRILQPEIMPSFETMQIYSAGANSRPVPVSRFQAAARVMSVYLVDMVSRSIDYRLQWMKKNQETIFGGTR
jgi:hypothetical protein